MEIIYVIILLFGVFSTITVAEATYINALLEEFSASLKAELFLNDLIEEFEDLELEGQANLEIDATTHVSLFNEVPPFQAATLNNSMIIGKYMPTIKRRTIYAFQGFRYADTLESGLRFKPPKSVDKFWEGDTFYATHIGFKCPQKAYIGSSPAGSEDCLYLNVYTPYHPLNNTELLPVILYIHGSAFIIGDSSMYLPTKLLDHDVILVTIHYRLGSFGFLTLNNADAPGNSAIYDCIEALKWTQRHIEDFGGDKTKVTVFGESAGSVLANYMMLLPAAKGLFRGVISDSGSALDHWAMDEDPSIAINYIADYLNCPTENDEVLFNCLLLADAYDLVRATDKLERQDLLNGGLGFRGTTPTIQDPTLINSTTYELIFTKRPREYFHDRDFNDVPFLTGANKQEGSFILGIMVKGYLNPHGLLDNQTFLREELVNYILKAMRIVDDTQALATSLTLEYCSGFDLGDFNDSAPCLIDMLGVLFFKAGSWEMVDLHSYYSDQKTFPYSFEFDSNESMYYLIFGDDPPYDTGVTHSDELMYLFSMPRYIAVKQEITMDRMTTLWTNFAIYGDPTPDEDSNWQLLGLPKWTPYAFEDHHYLLIKDQCTVEEEYTNRWTITVDDMNEIGLSSTEETETPETKTPEPTKWTKPPTTSTTAKKTTSTKKPITASTKKATTKRTKTTTTTTAKITTQLDPTDCYPNAVCAKIKQQRKAYEITMIVFIVAFVVACGFAIYFSCRKGSSVV